MTRLAVTLVCCVVVLAGCGPPGSGSDPDASTLTEAEANAEGADLITDAAGRLSPPPKLVELPNQDVPCEGLSKSGPSRLTIGRRYQLLGLDHTKADDHIATLRAHWTEQGYTVLDGSATYPLLRVEQPDDGFTLSFSIRNDVAEMSAVLSCIWPDGAPPTR